MYIFVNTKRKTKNRDVKQILTSGHRLYAEIEYHRGK